MFDMSAAVRYRLDVIVLAETLDIINGFKRRNIFHDDDVNRIMTERNVLSKIVPLPF